MNMVPSGDKSRGIPGYDISGLNILILEKQMLMRNLMKQMFREFRVDQVQMTDNPEEAFGLFLQSPADIILSDWSHGLDGIGFLRRVRAGDDSPNPFVPVIVVTANTEIRHVCEARDAGMTEFLAKPVSAKSIYARLCAVIDSTRPFIRVDGFFGPDRRRRNMDHGGIERRTR